MPLSPEQIALLVKNGDLSAKNLGEFDLSRDEKYTALKAIFPNPVDAVTPAVMAGGVGELAGLGGKMLGNLPKVGDAAKSAWNHVAPMVGGSAATAIGQKIGVPWWVSYPLGSMAGGKASFAKPGAPPPAPKPWGERSAPIAGNKPYGPSNAAPTKGPMQGPELPPGGLPPGLPGKAPNSPSGPSFPPGLGSGLPRASEAPDSQWRGPAGQEANWKPVSPASSPTVKRGLSSGEENGISELDKYFDWKYGPAGRPNTNGGTFPERQPPTGPGFDETDKRKIMFGGVSQVTGDGTAVPPGERKPIGLRKPKK